MCYCEQFGIPLHEIGHALGLYHEQERPDREDYVTILEDNIIFTQIFNFELTNKTSAQTHAVPYDYGSVVHYDAKVGP